MSFLSQLSGVAVNLKDLYNYMILLKIFRHLDPFFISRTLTLVCRRFNTILSDAWVWRTSLFHTLKRNTSSNRISIIHPCFLGYEEKRWWCDRDILWKDISVQISILEGQFKTYKERMIRQTFISPHYASVDTVKIIGDNDTIVSGGRDTMINVWNVDRETLALKNVITKEKGHEGWVWDIDSCTPDTFCSCGWDSTVNHWSIYTGLNKIGSYKFDQPVKGVSCTRGLIAAGLHKHRIALIDPRIGIVGSASNSYSVYVQKHNITDVLLVPEKNYVLSTSEGKTVSIFDLRKLRPSVNIPVTVNGSFPRRLEYHRDVLYIGDSRGNVHSFSLTQRAFSLVKLQVINVGSSHLITAVVPHLSGITVGSTDRYLRILYPSDPPVLLMEKHLLGEITAADQKHNILAVSTTNNGVNVFRPCDM